MQGPSSLGKILLWHDKKLTGMVLFCINLCFYLKIFAGYSLFSLFSWVLFTNVSAFKFYNFFYTGQQVDVNVNWVLSFLLYFALETIVFVVGKIECLEQVIQIGLVWVLLWYASSIMSLCVFFWAFANSFFVGTYFDMRICRNLL